MKNQLSIFSVDESETKTITTVQLVDSYYDEIVDEVVVECDLVFSASHDQVINQTTIVGHVGKNAVMTFYDFYDFYDSGTIILTVEIERR